MTGIERFYQNLGEGIIAAGGAFHEDKVTARRLADEAWRALQEIGTDDFPCMVELHDIRFVYQWDMEPPVVVVMAWDEQMWRNTSIIEVPEELIA